MWTPLVFLAIVGFVFGAQTPWKPNQEYTYNIYARTLTALPDLKDQYVGVVTKGNLILHPQGDGQIIGKLVKVAYAHFHDDLVGGWDSEIPEQMLSFQESRLSNKQFIMRMKNGVIENVLVDPSMTNDEVNQLKAMLSQLQIDITGENLIQCKHNQLPEKNENPSALYKTMESTITGECETVYDIEPLPEYMVERMNPNWAPRIITKPEEAKGEFFHVVKTMNFNNCKLRKGYHFGLTGESDFKPNTNKMGDFLSKSSMTKIIASGHVDDFTIHQVYTTNRIVVSPAMYQEQKAHVISQIQLALTKVQAISKQMEGPHQPVNTGNLVYSYNLPSDKENKIREVAMNLQGYDSYENEETKRMRIRRELIQDSEEISSGLLSLRQKTNSLKTGDSSSSSESFEDLDTQRHHFQPKPNMRQAPEIPLHPFTIGNKGRSIQHDSQVNVEGAARKLAQEIAEDLQNQDELPKRDTLEKYDILTDLVRVMNYDQIQNVAQQLHFGSRQHSENLLDILARKSFRDAVAQAGTGPAVNAITKWILERKIKGDEAADVLVTMTQSVQTPTEELIKTLYNLIKNEEIRKQKELYPTALIVFTDLIRRAQVDERSGYNYYPVQSFGPFYKELEQLVSKEIIPHLAQRLQEAVQQKNAQLILLYLRALGNTGHPDIVGVYEKYIERKHEMTPFERTALVISMDRLAHIYPKMARRVLYKIYANIAETPETRSAAVHLLMRTKPSAAMLQRMAEYTHEDPSEAVQAIVKSAIESAAELTDKEWIELAENAAAAKQYLNPRDYGRQYSKTYLRDYVSENLKTTYRQQLSHIVGRDHTFPQAILYTVYKNYGGFEAKNIEVQAMISSVDELLKLIPNADQPEQSNEKEYRAGGDEWNMDRIEKMLNIERDEAEDLEGQLLFNIMGRQRYFSFDEKTLKDLPQAAIAAGSVFAHGEKLTMNKLYNRRQVVVAFPLATGYPFYYTYSLPTLLQAVGEIQGTTTPDVMQSPSWETLRQVEAVNVTAKLHFVFSSEQIAKAGFITPFERQRYVAGHIRKIQGHVPLNLKVDIDIKHRQITGKMAPLETNKNFELFHVSAWPFTARKDAYSIHPVAQAKDVKMVQTQKTEKYDHTVGEKSTGMVFRAHMEHQFLPMNDYSHIERTLQRQGVLSLTSLPYSYQSTMQRILDKRMFTPLSLLPFSFEPTAYGPAEKQIIMTLAALPFAEDFTTHEIIRGQGVLSLLSLPFADVETLDRTSRHAGALSIGMIPWPMRTLNHYQFSVKYDAERSENQMVKFSLALKRAFNLDKSFAASRRMTGPAAVDEQKLSQTSDITPNSKERRAQFLENAASGIKQPYAAVLDASLVFEGKSPAEFVATISHASSVVDEKERVLAFLSAKPVKKSNRKQMCLTYTSKFPHAPVLNYEDAIKHSNKANAKLQIAFGEDCKSTQVNMKVALEQTSEYKQILQKSDVVKHCQHEVKQGDYLMPACLEATYRANIYDQIAISGELQNPTPEINNITHRAIALLRHIGFWHLDENVNDKGKPNRMEATIRIDPTLEYLNAYIQTGISTQKYRNLRIAPVLRTFFNVHQQMDIQAHSMSQLFRNGHVCVVDATKVFTFDDAIMKPQIGQCWYSVFQHVAPKSNIAGHSNWDRKDVAVLARAAGQQPDKKEVMIVVSQKNGEDHVVLLKSAGSSFHVSINGQEQKLTKDKEIDVFDKVESTEHREEQQPAVRIVELPAQEVKVEVRGRLVQVLFDGVRIKIKAAPAYRNNVRGLCGNFNGEQVDDLATPKNCILKSERHFGASWALPEQSCSNEVKQMKAKAEQARCAPIHYDGGNVISNWEAGRLYNPRQTRPKWSSESDSSSSSDSSSDEYYGQRQGVLKGTLTGTQTERKCNLKNQVQFVEITGRTCFSIDSLPACPSHCVPEQTEYTEVPVHCRDSDDSVAQLYKQQIRKGANPDMSSKQANHNVTFKIPRKCVARRN